MEKINILPLTGLPRSGSTLLLYILNQNSKFTIGPDSEIANILNHNKRFIEDNIFHFQLPHEKVSECFLKFCREGVNGWISEICDNDKIFIDKSRHWMIDLDYIFNVFPDIKLLVTIRDLRGILNSYEKINSNSLFVKKHLYNKTLDSNLQIERAFDILNFDYIKSVLFTLKEISEVYKNYNQNLKICRYEDTISFPKQQLDSIYNFLNIDTFNHDFSNIEQSLFYDNPYQPYGCHKIKNKIDTENNNFKYPYLSEKTNEYIINNYSWYYEIFYPEVVK